MIRATGPYAKTNCFRWSTKLTDDDTDMVYYGYRYYSSSTGKWLSRSDIHKDATAIWAESVGYPFGAATAIGVADDAVDGWGTGPLPIPFFQDPSYHFNQNSAGSRHSRLAHTARHILNAVIACSVAVDDPNTAADELGTALWHHSILWQR